MDVSEQRSSQTKVLAAGTRSRVKAIVGGTKWQPARLNKLYRDIEFALAMMEAEATGPAMQAKAFKAAKELQAIAIAAKGLSRTLLGHGKRRWSKNSWSAFWWAGDYGDGDLRKTLRDLLHHSRAVTADCLQAAELIKPARRKTRTQLPGLGVLVRLMARAYREATSRTELGEPFEKLARAIYEFEVAGRAGPATITPKQVRTALRVGGSALLDHQPSVNRQILSENQRRNVLADGIARIPRPR